MTLRDTPQLTTNRLTLRAPTPQDRTLYGDFYALSDVTIGGYRGGRSATEVDAILARDIAHWTTHGFGMFLVHTQDTGVFVGGAGLYHPDGFPVRELTWWMMPAARGKGYATEASLTVIDWAHKSLGWPRVETYMRDENAPARQLALRIAAQCGGHLDRRETFPDGVTRDIFVLSQRALV